MNDNIGELKFEEFEVSSSGAEVSSLTSDQIELIAGGQCTTNSI